MSEIIGNYIVPKRLVDASNKEILKWARRKLNGQEPDLTGTILKGIKDGRIKNVFLQPKIPGTFLPDGTFVEAMLYSPTIGDDFSEAEKEWEKEEKISEWIKKENKKFNKNLDNKNNMDYWKHGKRIVHFANQVEEPTHVICKKLGELGYENDYHWLSHSLHVDFYNWKPNIDDADPVLLLTWKSISDILMFGRSSNKMKDFILEDIQSRPFEKLKSQEIYLLLNGNLDNYGCSIEDKGIIEYARNNYKQMIHIESAEKNKILEILKTYA